MINLGPLSEVVTENDVWVGMNGILLRGLMNGSGLIIGVESIVTIDAETDSLYASNPAKN